MATDLPVAKALIKYNSNRLGVNEEEEKEPINIEPTEQKTEPYNDENAIDFRLSGVQYEDEKDITLANLIENYKSKLMRKIFQKSNWINCSIVPNEK